MKKLTVLLMCVCCVFTAQAQKQFTLNSPGGNLQTTITIGDQLTYDITCDGRTADSGSLADSHVVGQRRSMG